MTEIAIKVEGIGKKYEIGKKKSGSFRESFSGLFSKGKNQSKEEFWALNDVSFEIKKGEAVGVIGRNGAGKSTLLKLLSRITQPTTGRIEINGRVASLLEVGTGFHPELTGRENIYLNGTILGMTRKEVRNKFDEIVAFSGVEKFIDTPVKRYSSGMYVRLAFSVAAHLEPEILVVDEVLAVGDAEFQKKCLGKMGEVAGKGRTVLFVSHNMGAVKSLCTQGIYLKHGNLERQGEINEVLSLYAESVNDVQVGVDNNTKSDGNVEVLSIQLVDDSKQEISTVPIGQKVGVKVIYKVKSSGFYPKPNIHLKKSTGEKVFISVSNPGTEYKETGVYEACLWIPAHFLNQGGYIIGLAISTLNPVVVHFNNNNVLYFEVVDDLNAPTRAGYTGIMDGVIRPLLDWDLKKLENL